MKEKKAYIEILKGSQRGKRIPLQFNPSEYTKGISNAYENKKMIGRKDFLTQFKGSEEKDLSLELMFDSTDTGEDVRSLLDPLNSIVTIDPELHAPPPCRFVWADTVFRGVVTEMEKRFIFFYRNGIPARVKVTLRLKPYKSPEEIEAETKRHSSDITKERVLKEGDSLWLLAYREYGDPSLWRLIARYNGIEDPLRIESGKRLSLPPKGRA